MHIDGLTTYRVSGLLGCGLFLGIALVLIFAGSERTPQTEPSHRRPAFYYLLGMAGSLMANMIVIQILLVFDGGSQIAGIAPWFDGHIPLWAAITLAPLTVGIVAARRRR